jgi:hypothetical protein
MKLNIYIYMIYTLCNILNIISFLLNITQVDLHPPTVVGSTINQGPAKKAWDRYKRKLYHTSGVFFLLFSSFFLLCFLWDRYKRKLYFFHFWPVHEVRVYLHVSNSLRSSCPSFLFIPYSRSRCYLGVL